MPITRTKAPSLPWSHYQQAILEWVESGSGHAEQILEQGRDQAADRFNIGLDDLLWLPHVLNLQPKPKDWVLVDEAQDLSPAQLDLVLKLFLDSQAQMTNPGAGSKRPSALPRVRGRRDSFHRLPVLTSLFSPSGYRRPDVLDRVPG